MNELTMITNDGAQCIFGAITNGKKKTEFNIYNYKEKSNIEIGTKIELFGDLKSIS